MVWPLIALLVALGPEITVTASSTLKVKDGAVAGKMSLQQWQAVLAVNLTGVFLCGREAAERMIRLKRGGVIVNISSISRAGNFAMIASA